MFGHPGIKGFSFSMAILLSLTCPSAAQDGKPLSQAVAVPTLESLPHVALPSGAFKTWCGRSDRFLLDANGQLEAYDAGVKSATIAVSSSWPVRCSQDGKQLVYVDTNMGYLTQVDIATGNSRLLASYTPAPGVISPVFSPDLKAVATITPLTPAPETTRLKVLVIKEKAHFIKWSDDSSRLLVNYSSTVQVLDTNGATIGSGPLPPRKYLEGGWFATDLDAVILYLASTAKDDNAVVRCRIKEWKCDPLKSRSDSVSVGGHGVIGIIAPLGKPPPPSGRDEDDPPVFDKYTAELRDGAFKLRARQVFLTAAGKADYEIYVAPSGRKMVLTWHAQPGPNCPASDASYCASGILVDISRVFNERSE